MKEPNISPTKLQNYQAAQFNDDDLPPLLDEISQPSAIESKTYNNPCLDPNSFHTPINPCDFPRVDSFDGLPAIHEDYASPSNESDYQFQLFSGSLSIQIESFYSKDIGSNYITGPLIERQIPIFAINNNAARYVIRGSEYTIGKVAKITNTALIGINKVAEVIPPKTVGANIIELSYQSTLYILNRFDYLNSKRAILAHNSGLLFDSFSQHYIKGDQTITSYLERQGLNPFLQSQLPIVPTIKSIFSLTCGVYGISQTELKIDPASRAKILMDSQREHANIKTHENEDGFVKVDCHPC